MRTGTIIYRRADMRDGLEVEYLGPSVAWPFIARGDVAGVPHLWSAPTLIDLVRKAQAAGAAALAGSAEYGPDDPDLVARILASMFGVAPGEGR